MEEFYFQLRWQDRWELVSGNCPPFLHRAPHGCIKDESVWVLPGDRSGRRGLPSQVLVVLLGACGHRSQARWTKGWLLTCRVASVDVNNCWLTPMRGNLTLPHSRCDFGQFKIILCCSFHIYEKKRKPPHWVLCKVWYDLQVLRPVPGTLSVMIANYGGGCHGFYFYLSCFLSFPWPASFLPGGRLSWNASSCN